MTRTPFMPEFDQLPGTLPIFPLPDAVVMPGSELPLNIFEPRYLNMVADAMGSHRMFGMMQPDPSRTDQPEAVFRTGCAGRITSYRETADGRIELVLTGLCRFNIREEVPGIRGYRLVQPDWEPYRTDYDAPPAAGVEHRDRLLYLLKNYFRHEHLETDWKTVMDIPPERLVNTLTTLLPLGGLEKQAILEAVSAQERVDTLITALEMQVHEPHSTPPH
jgi:Lon protease-like protein